MHKLQGHDVHILASTETFIDNKVMGFLKPSTYTTEFGVPIKRIAYKKILPRFIMKKLRVYKGLYKELSDIKPDIIFIHGHQFTSIYTIKEYVKKNRDVKVFIDCHADEINGAKNWLSKLNHKIVYRWCAKVIEPYTAKFYGTLLLRCDYLHSMYGVPKEKIEFLPMGVDDSDIDIGKKDIIRETIRKQIGLDKDAFVIVTGGKLGKRRNILQLMRFVGNCNREDIKLVIFGSIQDEIKEEFETLVLSEKIHYLGWLESTKINELLMASDLAVFPGLHSVLWEQAVGLGVPCVFNHIQGITHVDLGGNCKFLYENSIEELRGVIMALYDDRDELYKMREIAELKGMSSFSYNEIAKHAIDL